MSLSDVEQRAILAEYIRRTKNRARVLDSYKPTANELGTAQTLRSLWFPQQAAFFESPHKRKLAFCTRRSGKTIGLAIDYDVTLLEHPTALMLYVAQTRDMCRLYIWQELKRYARTYNLPFEFNEQNLTMKHVRGGGMLVLKGCDKEDEIEKWRGPKWLKVGLDEAGTWGAHLENAVISVIGPATRDQDGTIEMLGTAGKKKEGMFYEASTGKRKIWEVHRWSLTDNPYLPAKAKDLAYIREEEGLTEDDPRYIREYLGRWSTGDSERVFSGFTQERNVYDGEPWPHKADKLKDHEWKYLLGCDFGFMDECAISVIAYSSTYPQILIPSTWSSRHAFPSDVASHILDYRAAIGVRRYVGDAGGLGKMYVVQLARDYGIMMEPAKKMEKLNFVEFLNSEFRSGKVLIHNSQQKLIAQFNDCAWNADRTDVGKHERDDLAFSAVYGWRAARNSGAGKKEKVDLKDGLTPLQRQAIQDKLNVLRMKPDDPEQRDRWYEAYGGRHENVDRNGGEWWSDLLTRR